MESTHKEKYILLKNNIALFGNAAIAFSGGVDSTLLLKTAYDVLGNQAIAFLGNSPFQIPAEITKALRIAEQIGCRIMVVDFDLASDDRFCSNRSDRCYYCKKHIYTVFLEKMSEFGCSVLMDGTNLDDTLQDRPGAKAIEELKVVTPLLNAQLTKREIRHISKNIGLPTWNKFSGSCLATRIQTGKKISLSDIAIITEIEGILNKEGFQGSRLKISEKYAVVSLVQGNHARFVESKAQGQIINILKIKGFKQLFLDLSGREGILT